MTKQTLIQALSRATGQPEPATARNFELLLELLSAAFETEQEVDLGESFGRFVLKDSGGKSVYGTEDQHTKKYRNVVFKESADLKRRLRQNTPK